MRLRRTVRFVGLGVWAGVLALGATPAAAGIGDQSDGQDAGVALPNSDRLRVTVDFMAGYGTDRANSSLGFERQGRIGYAIFTAKGKLNDRLSYLISVNPVNETEPLPACGESGFFFPNDPKVLYGASTQVACEPKNGNRRVDAYRGVALDVVPQQGAIREAYLGVRLTTNGKVRFGRSRLPIGFDWQEAGSFTAKDAPRIQRIDAQDSYGMVWSYERPAEGRPRPIFSGNLAGFLGAGNRWWDYNYYYFEDGSLAANTDLTVLTSGTFSPVGALEIRTAYQKGTTGSKVERRPSYWASKRNDDAAILSASYQPIQFVRILAEGARYTWGPTKTSAAMLGVDQHAIQKQGYYVTAEAWCPIGSKVKIGGSVTKEELAREDSLVRLFATQNLYQVTTGKTDRMLVVRAFVDITRQVRVGFYRTLDSNPYPWLSGISPIVGTNAFATANTNKWGLVARLRVL